MRNVPSAADGWEDMFENDGVKAYRMPVTVNGEPLSVVRGEVTIPLKATLLYELIVEISRKGGRFLLCFICFWDGYFFIFFATTCCLGGFSRRRVGQNVSVGSGS